MSEVKTEGLEVVAFEVSFPLGIGRKVYEQEQAWANHNYGSGIVYHVDPLCRHSEALAGYAVRDAQIAKLGRYKRFESLYVEAQREADQLRAELAAAKETISRYETTAENCDLLRSANSAVVMPAVPDGYKLVPIEPTAAQCFTAAFNLCNEFGEELVRDNKQFAMAAYRWLVAASPAAKGAKQ